MDAELFKAVSAVLGCFAALNMISLFLIFSILHMSKDILQIILDIRTAKNQGTAPPAPDDD